jgi:hypothetical protein
MKELYIEYSEHSDAWWIEVEDQIWFGVCLTSERYKDNNYCSRIIQGGRSDYKEVFEKDVPEEVMKRIWEYISNPFFEIDLIRYKESLK